MIEATIAIRQGRVPQVMLHKLDGESLPRTRLQHLA